MLCIQLLYPLRVVYGDAVVLADSPVHLHAFIARSQPFSHAGRVGFDNLYRRTTRPILAAGNAPRNARHVMVRTQERW